MAAKKKTAKKKRPVGRPRAMTQAMKDEMVDDVRTGATKKACAMALGISMDAVEKEAKRDPQFGGALARAEGFCRKTREQIGSAGGKGSSSMLNYLACRWPEDWSPRRKIEVTGKDGGPVEVTWWQRLTTEESDEPASD